MSATAVRTAVPPVAGALRWHRLTAAEACRWAFTGPLLAIVGVTLVAGEVIVARQMRRPREAANR